MTTAPNDTHSDHADPSNGGLGLVEELRASEERFYKIFDASPSMIAITTAETGRIYDVNRAWVDVFGYTKAEAVGHTAFELNLWFHPADREALITAFQIHGFVRDYQVYMRTKSGEGVYLLVNGDQIEFDGELRLLLVINDITARVKAEGKLKTTLDELELQIEARTRELTRQVEATQQARNELLDSEQRLQDANRMLHLVLDSIPVRVFWKDRDLRYLGCNRVFAMDVGFSSSRQINGKTDLELPWQDEAARHQSDDRAVIDSGRAKLNYEEPQTTPDGQTVWLRTSKIPLRNGEGDVIGVLGMYEDITHTRQTALELERAKETAETANLAKSQFLSAMSHELRTPLNSILGFAQLLEYDPERPLADVQQEHVDYIKSGGKHLLNLINEILDLAKIESDKAEFDIAPAEASRLFQEVVPMAAALADKAGIALHTPALQHDQTTILVDFMRAKQALLNLLSNAVKYNREAGEVTLSCAEEAGCLRVYVTDTGPGIPTDKLAELFQPFARLGAEETAIEGTGIGLTITKELVERMNGRIGVVSEEGTGSTFWMDFPLSDAAAAPADADDFLKDGRVEDAGFDGTVLYVEDNAANTLFMESVFERFANLRLITATNAEDGIDTALAEQPDMLILDIALPGMSGNEAVKRLRQSGALEDKPIVALSANAMQAHIDEGLAAGFDAYLTKPLDIKELMRELEKAFGQVVLDD